MIFGGASIFLTIFGALLSDKIGRKSGFFLAWGLIAVGWLTLHWPSTVLPVWASYSLICLIQIGNGTAFVFCYLHTSEYFPTVFRGTMFGICNGVARAGGILAPEMSSYLFPDDFMLVFGLVALCMFFINTAIYETKGV